jgi:signal peptidase I
MVWMAAATAAALTMAIAVGVHQLRRSFAVVTVLGSSMQPTLRDGDRVLVRRCHPGEVRRGDIVVAEPPAGQLGGTRCWNIKRVVALPGDAVPADVPAVERTKLVPASALVLRGDSEISMDSRQLGFYELHSMLGVVVRRI